ncbi:hypothetical protein FACS1894216_16280 [Synergistales bacterium]|nr:hypothetical protein FACS1894216_16280 [Synergistales bacterium]
MEAIDILNTIKTMYCDKDLMRIFCEGCNKEDDCCKDIPHDNWCERMPKWNRLAEIITKAQRDIDALLFEEEVGR